MNPPRRVILHAHLFKNAGTTLDWSLRRSFGDRFVDHRDDERMRLGRAGYLREYLAAHAEVLALSSHHLSFPLPAMDGVLLLPVVMLRNPVDRAGSVYRFERSQEPTTPGAVNAKDKSFREYVLWRLTPGVGRTIRDFQIAKCLPKERRLREPCDYASALREITSGIHLGIVEEYDASMVCLEETLRRHFPAIDLSYTPQNVSRKGNEGLAQRIEGILAELGDEATRAFVEHNQWDLLFYLDAKKVLRERIRLVEDFQGKLGLFRERCRRLQGRSVRA